MLYIYLTLCYSKHIVDVQNVEEKYHSESDSLVVTTALYRGHSCMEVTAVTIKTYDYLLLVHLRLGRLL